MKTINRKSIEIRFANRRSLQRLYINVNANQRQVYFTAAASSFCELTPKSFIHFQNEGSTWLFYVNDDPDGFPLILTTRKGRASDAYRLCHSGLTNMILSSHGFKSSKRFAVEKTNIQHDRCVLYKLVLEKVSKVIR